MGDIVKNIIGIITLCVMIVFVAGYNLTKEIDGLVVNQTLNSVTIIIDAGHGGYDPGATVDQLNEADINLSIAKKLEAILIASGANVIMTRDSDIDLAENRDGSIKRADMKKRTSILSDERASFFISLHGNMSADSSCHGSQVYFQKSNLNSKDLANSIQDSLKDTTKSKYIPVSGDFYVLNESDNIGVLIEYGFLSNSEERSKLQDETYQESLAYSIYLGINNFLKKLL